MFQVRKGSGFLQGRLVYSRQDRAFDFFPQDNLEEAVPAAMEGTTSFAGRSIQLEVAIGDGRILYPWGYCPQASWIASKFPLPRAGEGVVLDESLVGSLVPGVSMRLEPDLVRIEHDEAAGVVRFMSGTVAQYVVLIAEGVQIGVADGVISDLWLRPETID